MKRQTYIEYYNYKDYLLYRRLAISFIKDNGKMNIIDIILITNFRLVYQRPVCPERAVITIK